MVSKLVTKLSRSSSSLSYQLRDLITPADKAIANPPQGTFVKGINFGGEALRIEGNDWESYSAALDNGLSIAGFQAIATSILPVPYVGYNIRQMLNSIICNPETLDITQTLPNGIYNIYLWIMENYQNDWHSLEIRLQGKTVATEVGKLPFRQWARYGPYSISVTEGALNLTISTNNPKIDAHIMGMSIFKAN
jgi:hypothetical protein